MSDPSVRPRWLKAARYATYCAAAAAVLVIAAALLVPWLLDQPAVAAQLKQKLSDTIRGEVAWEDLSLRILPRPLGVLRKSRVRIPGRLEISAEELSVRLAFWPLLRGRAEIVSVTLSRPAIFLDVPPASQAPRPEKEADLDLLRIYRLAAGALADILRRFAPETVVSIEDARMEITAPGILPIALHDVALRLRTGREGLDLDGSLSSTHWSRLTVAARLQFADLGGHADIGVTGLKPQAWLDQYLAGSPVRLAIGTGELRVRARTDGTRTLEGEFDASTPAVNVRRDGERIEVAKVGMKGKVSAGGEEVVIQVNNARLGPSSIPGGSLRYSLKNGSLAGDVGYDLDVAQGMDAARRLVPASARAVLARFQPATGRAQGRVKLALGRTDWQLAVQVAKSDAAVQIRDLPGPVRLAHGTVEIDPDGVRVTHAAASMPAGEVRLVQLHHAHKQGSTAIHAEFDADLARGLEAARSVVPERARDELAVLESAGGRARGDAKLAFGRKEWSVAVNVRKADGRVQVRGLPGAAGFSSGSVLVLPGSVKVERAAVSLLDAQATASVAVSYGKGLQVQGSIAEGTVGDKLLEWVWKIAEAPPQMALKGPITVAAPQFSWSPKGALNVQATARFVDGPTVAADLGWAAGALNLRRAALKDQRSNAVVSARVAGARLEGRFSGMLHGSSIAALLKTSPSREGSISGDLRLGLDRNRPEEASADGSLRGESLDLSWLAGRPLKVERINLAAKGETLQVREATVDLAGQRATLRGEVKRGPDGPVIAAQVDSPGINLDVLTAEGPASAPAEDGPAGKAGIWPLPVTGQLAVRSDFVQRGRYRVAPLAGTITLQQRSAKIVLDQAQLCGISLPLMIEATPDGLVAAATIEARKQQLQQSAHCLADQQVLITGEFDLTANITAQGQPGDFARSLKGSVVADMRDGDVMKFAMLGNILSMQNVAALFKDGAPNMDAKGFPYRSMRIAGRFDDGRFMVEEGAFHSDAVGLAANGWISLVDYQSRLTVLVAPFSRLDQLVRGVPVLGYVVGGVFTSVPVGVSGDIRDPLVVPLGPAAVTSEVLGIFERTLKLPVKLVTPREKSAP